jgi:hypothetical protein
MWLAPAAFILLIAPAPAPPPSDVDRYRRMMAAAPGNGGVMYELAKALAAAGEADEAMRWLTSAFDQGLDLDLGDPALQSLASRSDFIDLELRANHRAAAAAKSHLAFRIPEKDLIPEGIAFDSRSGDFFVGSLYRKKIVRVRADGEVTDFVKSGQDGLEDVLGLKVDGAGQLWACTVASGRARQKAGSSALFKYDIATGRLLQSFWLPNKDARHLLNDLVLGADGTVFVTDSDANSIHRLPRGALALEPLVDPGVLLYPNGIAMSADGGRLYVADFKNGLSIVDVATKAVRALPHPPDVSTAGIDGLYLYGGALLGIQNGAGRERVVRYALSADGERVEGMDVLEGRNPFFRIPTTGVLAGGDFVYLANANLEALDDDGNLKKDAPLEEVVALRLPLTPRP